MYSYQYKLQGLTCEACAKIVQKKIEKVEGVTETIAELNGNLEIKSERELDKTEVVEALRDTDYKIL